MPRRPADQAAQIYTDAYVISSLITPALSALDVGLGGWPTSTPGAAPLEAGPAVECTHPDCTNTQPCPEHSPPVVLTSTERYAGQHDKARADLEALTRLLRRCSADMATAARICRRWGLAGVDQSTVKARLASIDRDIWCANCGQYGWKEPRLPEQTECDFCSQFRRDYGRPCPKEVLDVKRYRTHVSEADKQRILNTIDPDWRRKLTKKRKGKAA